MIRAWNLPRGVSICTEMDLLTRLSCLFGTEEIVNYRRLLVLLREKILTLQQKDNEGRVICSGSLGEGVAYPPSDDDLMCVIEKQSLRVYGNYEEALQHQALYMSPSYYSPGFCVLLDTVNSRPFTSKLFRDLVVLRLPTSTVHGPCASVTSGIFEFDYAECLSSPHWPMIANEWITRRQRHGWPSRDLIQIIVREGCHVVPIGNPDSPCCDNEWRVSFSLAERKLIHEFNHVQFIAYNLLKLILKRVIEIQVPNVLCSYFLKTTLFYAIENTPSELWVPANMEECYSKCLLLLYHFIDTMNCPNYFVQSNNMMRRKVNANNKAPLLSIVGDLMRCGIGGSLHLCGETVALLPGLSQKYIELRLDNGLITGYLWETMMYCLEFYIHNFPVNDVKMILSPILSLCHELLTENNSNFLSLLCRRVFTFTGSRFLNRTMGGPEGNKSRYEFSKLGEALLRIGRNIDVSSSRLHLANYMFMTGRIQPCLMIIKSILSKYPPYAMSITSTIAVLEVYRDVICNKGYSLQYKLRKGWPLDVFVRHFHAAVAPVPLNILLAVGETDVRLHSLFYSYFLQGLCFHQTRDSDAMDISVTLLEDTVRDFPTYAVYGIFHGRFLLGYMRMLQQDYYSSCRCLTSAFLMKEEIKMKQKLDYTKHAKACIVLLACVINHVLQ